MHAKEHTPTQSSKCNKCDRTYPTMSKLRRHDWRSHREIECNLCGNMISSRQEIKAHRESTHNMFRRIFCRFYPDCLDEEECLYEHGNDDEVNTKKDFCVNGDKCDDQECNFSEQRHEQKQKVLCKFQSNCTRLHCPYKHNSTRKAFLEVSFSTSRKR